MHGFAAVLAAFAMLAVPFGLVGTAAAQADGRDLTPIVIGPVETDRFGGGALVAVKAGETVFGVRYGTSEHPNNLVIFAEYKRYLGIAEIVDNQGNPLRTRGIPVTTVLGQSLDGFIEFEDRNADGLLNFVHLENRTLGNITYERGDLPVKGMRLNASWALEGPTTVVVDNTTYVNFTLSATNLPYGRRFNLTQPDGVLDYVGFTFHLQVDVVDRAGRIPAFRVSVDDGNEHVITNVTFLGLREVHGRAVAMGAKYDHAIEGWDFANGTNLLALETHFLFGNYIPSQVARFIHMVYDEHAENETRERHYNETTVDSEPRLFTRDRIYIADSWERVSRFEWVSDVTVDGQPGQMSFQVQGGSRLYLKHGLAEFIGFAVRGAFIYPNGASIFHDPAMYAESLALSLPSAVNLTPLTILAVQLGLVAIAMGPALYLRAKAKARRRN